MLHDRPRENLPAASMSAVVISNRPVSPESVGATCARAGRESTKHTAAASDSRVRIRLIESPLPPQAGVRARVWRGSASNRCPEDGKLPIESNPSRPGRANEGKDLRSEEGIHLLAERPGGGRAAQRGDRVLQRPDEVADDVEAAAPVQFGQRRAVRALDRDVPRGAGRAFRLLLDL